MVQDLVYGEDILAKLWYIPHINEIIYVSFGFVELFFIFAQHILKKAKGNVDRGKAPLDMTQKIYKNQMIWSRSISVHSLICDIYSLVQMFAVLVQDSAKYSASGNFSKQKSII